MKFYEATSYYNIILYCNIYDTTYVARGAGNRPPPDFTPLSRCGVKILVGDAGLEPATSSPRTMRATSALIPDV